MSTTFARWLYFRYAGWLERDQHVAETEFYESGGGVAGYNGDAILRDHLEGSGAYVPKPRVAAPAPEKGFATAVFGHRRLCFSELVTVEEFRRFVKHCVGYERRRRRIEGIEDWAPVNHPSDGGLPAAVTWHDAKAYARWFGSVSGLPVRLATEEEYLTIASGLAPDRVTAADLTGPRAATWWHTFHSPLRMLVGRLSARSYSDRRTIQHGGPSKGR